MQAFSMSMRALPLAAMIGVTALFSTPTMAQTETGSLRVVVQVPGTLEPIPGVQVTLTGRLSLAGAAGTTGVTDPMGIAVFDKVPFDSYTVRAERDGYLGAPPSRTSATTAARAFATAIVYITQTSPVGVTLFLTPGSTISGRVRGASGTTLTADRVTLGVIGYRDGRRTLLSIHNAQPDSQGNYLLTGVAPGEYYLVLEPNTLRGVGAYFPGVTDLEKATLVSIQSGQEVVGVDFEMPNIPTFQVSGKVFNIPPGSRGANGLPSQPNAITGFTFAPGDPNNPDFGNAPRIQNANRAANGEFEITLPAGDWNLYPLIPILAPGLLPSQNQGLPTYATGRTRVQLVDRDIQNVNITIGSSDVKVRITGGLPSTTTPLQISLVPRDSVPSPLLSHIRRAQALDSNGEFTFNAVPPGRYSLQLTGLPGDAHVVDIRVGSRSVFDDGIITVGLEPLEAVEVLLSRAGGSINGTIASPTPSGAESALRRVALVPSAPRRQNPLLYKAVAVFAGAGAAARFSFTGVPPGDYKVFAFQSLPLGGAERDPFFMAPYESFGVPVKVVAGTSISIEVPWVPQN